MGKENNLFNKQGKASSLPPEWKHPVIPGNAVQGMLLVTSGNIIDPPETSENLQWIDMEELAKTSSVKLEYDSDNHAYILYKGNGHRLNNGDIVFKWERVGAIVSGEAPSTGYEPDSNAGMDVTDVNKIGVKLDEETMEFTENGEVKAKKQQEKIDNDTIKRNEDGELYADVEADVEVDEAKGLTKDSTSHKIQIKVDGSTIQFDADGKLHVIGGGGGGGAVESVNGKVGIVVLSASDINATNGQSIQANLERIDGSISQAEVNIGNLQTAMGGKADKSNHQLLVFTLADDTEVNVDVVVVGSSNKK